MNDPGRVMDAPPSPTNGERHEPQHQNPPLLLLTLSLGVAGFHAGTETAGSRLAAVHAAAERAGYAFVVGQSDCPVDCDSHHMACPMSTPEDRWHKAPVALARYENLLGTGDHTFCERGSCSLHKHTSCDPGLLYSTTLRLLGAIEDRDWPVLAEVIHASPTTTYNHSRQAIQGLDCQGDHIGLHLRAPTDFVDFMATRATQ